MEAKGRRACEHLRQTVKSRGWCEDCTESGENLTSSSESISSSACEIQSRRRREARYGVRSRRREPHRYTKWWKIAALIASLAVVAFTGGLLTALSLLREAGTQPASSQSESDRLSTLPPAVLRFKDFQKAKIEATARDNVLPWLDLPPQPVGKLNVNLVLAEKSETSATMEMSVVSRLLGMATESTQVQADVAKIFHPDPFDTMQTLVSRVLVTADAGMGKTFTFAKMMPMRWLKEPNFWPQFDLIFVVLLGNPQTSSANTLQDFLFSSFGAEVEQSTRKKVTRFVSENPERVLVICDALDEGRSSLSDEVSGILNGTKHSRLHILITSRPCKAATSISKEAHRHFKLLGIRKDDLPEFILNHLGRDEVLANSLLADLYDRQDMLRLMTSPLIAFLVCGFFGQDKRLPATMTRLYENVVLNLIRRAGSKGDINLSAEDYNTKSILELSEQPRHILTLMSTLAACAEEKNMVFFTTKIMSSCFYRKTFSDPFWESLQLSYLPLVSKLGLLTYVTIYGPGLTSRVAFAFVHKTFQEFLAAFFMQRHCQTIHEQAVKSVSSTEADVIESKNNQEEYERLASCLDGILSERFKPPNHGGTDHNLILWFVAIGINSPVPQAVLTVGSLVTECEKVVESNFWASDLALLHLIAETFEESNRLLFGVRVCGRSKLRLVGKLFEFCDQNQVLQALVNMNYIRFYMLLMYTIIFLFFGSYFLYLRSLLTEFFFYVRGKTGGTTFVRLYFVSTTLLFLPFLLLRS